MFKARKPSKKTVLIVLRVFACLILTILIIGYTLGISTGLVPEVRRVATGDIVFTLVLLFVLAVLIRPDVFERLALFQWGNFTVQLNDVQKETRAVASDLKEVQFVLSMLVTDHELRHLDNLASGQTSEYSRRDELLSELRRLRAIDLIRSTRKGLFQMPVGGLFDLTEYVELTDRGRGYLARIEQTRPIP